MSTKTCPVCNSSKHTSAFSAVKHICNLCHLDGKTYTPPEKARKPTEAEILQAELAARTLARRRLIHFVQRFKPDYQAGWVHHDICRRLEQFVKDVEARKSPRLLLCMPPRSGKSELTSRNFPAWALGHHPEWEIIAASHTQSLALSFSRHLRDKIRDPAYEAVFPDCVLDPQSQSVENWNTTAGGGYLAAGIGSGITGRGSHILIIDDPVKDMEASDSQLIRDNTWDWYTCFHPETEILTYDGWKPVSEVALREAVATMDMSSGEMYYMPAVEVQSYDFDGELVDVWQRSGVSYRVTPNHNLHIASSKTGPIRTVRADETPETFYIPRSAKVFLGGTPPARTGFRAQHGNGKDFSCATTTWFKFFGAWLGDGSIYAPRGQVVLSAIKPRKRKFFTKVLSEMGVTFWEQERKVTFQNVEVARYLERFGGSHEKYIPENMKHAATPYLEALLEGLFETDGHVVDVDRRYRYVTTSKQLADDVMEIAVKCGYAVSYSVRPIGTYHLSLRKTYMTQVDARVRGKTNAPVRKMVPYKGKVHCVTVPPHHSVLIRDRGRISWSGQSTAYTRLAPGGGVLGIMTLWNDDDWGGRTITYSENGEGDKFEIVRYPAINEGYDEYQENETYSIVKKYPADPVPVNATLIRKADSALHPDRYDAEMLLKIKRNLYASGQQRVWSALYQQNPAPEEGAYFTKDLFRYYSTPPRRRGNFVYQAWDFAIAEGQENDYTVGATILQDERDALHVLDVKRFKSADSIYIVDVILDYAAEFDADLLGFEDGQIWKTMQAQFDKRCDERRMYPTYEILKPLTDKKARANPLKGRMQAGKVYFPDKAPWLHDVYTELLRFPAGKHDDCHSAATLVDSPNGPRQMIDLRDGDEILTYDGRRVLIGHVANHHCTGVKMVLEVTLEDGTRLELTAGHPVLTARGYVYAGDLLDSDEIVRKEVCTLYATVSSGHRSQTDTCSRQHSSTEKDNGCTDTLGSKSAAQSLLDATSTTLTETDQTTTSRIFSALHGPSTQQNTAMSVLRRVTRLGRGKILKESGNSPLKQKLVSTSVRKNRDDFSIAFGRARLAEQSSNWVRRTTTRLLTVLHLVSKRLAESTPSGSTVEPCHASSVVERSYLDGTESVIASSAPSHAVTSTDTQTSTSVESVKGAARPCTSRLGALRATAEIAKLLGRTCEKPNARPAGQRFYPETRMAAYSAIENVLTSCEDLSVTRRSTSDSNRLFVKVISIREIGFQETYNFDVAGTRNFLVENGIVVHNCVDALAWAVRLTLTRSAPKLPEPAKIKSWKDKLLTGGSLEGTSHMAA